MNVLIIFRSPVGGLFRHVLDLSHALVKRGCKVFYVFSNKEKLSDIQIEEISRISSGRFLRLSMSRYPGVTDIVVFIKLIFWMRGLSIDVVHGHGAKGGFYARVLRFFGLVSRAVYTPHGGVLHYSYNSFVGSCFLTVEKALKPFTDCFIFESFYSKKIFSDLLGLPACFQITHNGLRVADFYDSSSVEKEWDFIFVGEQRFLKGVDVFLRAINDLAMSNIYPKCAIFGDGPDLPEFKNMADKFGLRNVVFHGRTSEPMEVMKRAKCFILSSRNESLPYVLLEASALNVPIFASNVGGVSEIVDDIELLFESEDYLRLAFLMRDFLCVPQKYYDKASLQFDRVRLGFNCDQMADCILSAYH